MIEIPQRRTAYAKHSKDAATGRVRATFVTGDPIHYKDANGVYQTIDVTPERVINAQFDGWRIVQNSYHYLVGRDIAKDQDGWVGFGGKNGNYWLNFRLHSAGYFYPPTESYTALATANYDRSKLSRTTKKITVQGEEIHNVTGAKWDEVMPGVDIYWRVSGKDLKEVITLDRDGFMNLPDPATPKSGTFFGLVFEMDAINIPKWVKKGLQQLFENGFEDSDGVIEMHDDADDLIAFLPIDSAFSVDQQDDDDRVNVRLRKRFYTNNGRYWMLVGAPINELEALPKGNIAIDPTLELQPDETSAIDTWNEDPKFDNRGETNFGTSNGWHTQAPMHAAPRNAYIKWDLTSIPSGARATSASMTITNYYNGAGEGDTYVYPMLFEWEELELTWMQYKSGYPWPGSNGGETANVDYDGNTVLAHYTGPSSAYQTMTFPITNLTYLQTLFGTNPQNPNYGWVFQTVYGLNNMYSSNAGTASRRPKLVIEYEDVDPDPNLLVAKTGQDFVTSVAKLANYAGDEFGVFSQPPVSVNTGGSPFLQTKGEELHFLLALTKDNYWVQVDSSNNPSTFSGEVERYIAYLVPH